MIGTIKKYDPAKGWGFVRPDGASSEDVFFHRDVVRPADLGGLEHGARVSMEVERNPKNGKLRATELALGEIAGEG